ncbi:MAG: hypothetical protein ACT4OG_00635 [Alphaproteobacteria bacterium]
MRADDLLRLSLGHAANVTVCRLPLSVASFFDANTVEVKLSASTLRHIAKQHKHLFPKDILLIGEAVKRGMFVKESQRPNRFSAWYQHPKDEKKRFIVGLKFARGTHELWITTFHRAKKRQARALLARGVMLRKHV